MDEVVVKAMAKWPSVPAVYGWLSLDRRGQWYLRDEIIGHQGAVEFINRNYLADDEGRWFFQNGPQRVFVDLHYAPLVYFLGETETELLDHCGRPVSSVSSFWLDERGALLLGTDLGPGLLYDQDLAIVLEWMQVASGDEDELEQALEDPVRAADLGLRIQWRGSWFPVKAISSQEAGRILGFQAAPRETDGSVTAVP